MLNWLASYTQDTAEVVDKVYSSIEDLLAIITTETWSVIVKTAFELVLCGKIALA